MFYKNSLIQRYLHVRLSLVSNDIANVKLWLVPMPKRREFNGKVYWYNPKRFCKVS